MANVPLSGVEPAAFGGRDEVRLVENRTFCPDTNKIILGRMPTTQFLGLDLAFLALGRKRVGGGRRPRCSLLPRFPSGKTTTTSFWIPSPSGDGVVLPGAAQYCSSRREGCRA